MRKGSANTQCGAVRFIDELIARVRRAGAVGELTVRVDFSDQPWRRWITTDQAHAVRAR
jgi:hypothetical protein